MESVTEMSSSAPTATETEPPVNLVCWKIWGGNKEAATDVKIPGLRGVLHADPHQSARGGDVYYMSACGSGAVARLCLADVSGHGEDVSHVSAWLGEIFGRNIHRENPAAVLRAANKRSFSRGYDALSTAICVSYNSLNGKLHIGNAGHPHIRICREDSDVWEELKPPIPAHDGLWNVPLGVSAEALYGLGKAKLTPGDRLIFYTDGLIEARDPNGNLLGDEVWDRVPTDATPEEQLNALVSAYNLHIGSINAAQDDLTIIVLEVQPFQRGDKFSLLLRNNLPRLMDRLLNRAAPMR